jgi:hypothetical protein
MRRREFIAIFGGVVVGRRARLVQSGSSKLASTGSAYWLWCCRAGTLPTPQRKLFFNLLDASLLAVACLLLRSILRAIVAQTLAARDLVIDVVARDMANCHN